MSRSHSIAALLLCAALTLGCTLTFTPEAFQSLRLFFELAADLDEGDETVVQTLVFPEAVKLKKRFLRVAGALEDGGGALPSRLELVAETVDVATGRRLDTLKLTLKVAPDGSFSAVKKLKKNLVADSMMTVSVEAAGGRVERGTAVRLCVDVVRKKADLAAVPCAGGGGSGPATFSAIQAQIFTPSCATIGCHDAGTASAGLVLTADASYRQLVNVPSNQVPFRLRVEPGNPENSYLIMKLEGAAGIEGVRMPLDGPPFLTDAQIDGIASWIRSGAPNN